MRNTLQQWAVKKESSQGQSKRQRPCTELLRARSRLYRSRFWTLIDLADASTYFSRLFKLYKVYALLHRSKRNIFTHIDNLFDKMSTLFVKMCQKLPNCLYDDICQTLAKFGQICKIWPTAMTGFFLGEG